MLKLWAVLKREYLSRVKKRSFVILTLLGPLLLLGVYSLPVLFLSLSGTDRTLAVVDLGGEILPAFKNSLAREHRLIGETSPVSGLEDSAADRGRRRSFQLLRTRFRVIDARQPGDTVESARQRLNADLGAKTIDAYFIIGPDPDAENALLYGSRTSGEVPGAVERALREPALKSRSQHMGLDLDADAIVALARPLAITPIRVGKNGREVSTGEGQQKVVLAVVWVMAFLFYVTFLLWGSTILRGIVEEKSSRVMELLLSSMNSTQFMVGKVAGIGLVALTQIAVWAACGLAMTLWGGASVPQIADLAAAINPFLFGWFILLYLLGFAMYSVLYAAVGSTVTSTQESEQAAIPVTFLIVAAFFSMIAVQQAPDSTFSLVASVFPLTAPLAMLMRLGISDPPAWEIGLSLLAQGLAIAGLAWLAARIFRVGTLMYGKRATIPEIWKWIRTA
ncbi:MAG: ABC transporter permease [Acidobacteriota bacterium]